MMQRGFRVVVVAALTALLPMGAAFGADEGTNIQVERPVPAPPEPDAGYRPPWANPNAKPSQPGIENDPTPFDPSNVDGNSDTLNINNLDQ